MVIIIGIVDVLLLTATGENMQLDSGVTVSADRATASAISQRGKQLGDLAEQGLSEKLKELRTLISLFCDFQNNTKLAYTTANFKPGFCQDSFCKVVHVSSVQCEERIENGYLKKV